MVNYPVQKDIFKMKGNSDIYVKMNVTHTDKLQTRPANLIAISNEGKHCGMKGSAWRLRCSLSPRAILTEMDPCLMPHSCEKMEAFLVFIIHHGLTCK